MAAGVLVINGGSSSVKFALYALGPPLARATSGTFDRIASPDAQLTVRAAGGGEARRPAALADHAACLPMLREVLAAAPLRIAAVGHRVVHGGTRFQAPQAITAEVLRELRQLAVLAPEHAPAEIALIEACGRAYPDVPQVACFDTAFHAHLPRVAQLLPIPLRYAARGVRRYGFHGISYEYLLEELRRVDGALPRRVILAHLGNGASMAAVRDGRCIDTTMAFTPAAGLVMGSRAGDLDPGLPAWFARAEGHDAERFDRMVNAESGLLGLSETSADVRDLLARAAGDRRAADALAVFGYQARKWVGALAAALGGLDALVFAGGIGEHAAAVRADICAGLEHLGIALDARRNAAGAALISRDDGRVRVRVMKTDEELMIARATGALLATT